MKNNKYKLPTVDGFDPMAELDKLVEEAKALVDKRRKQVEK